MARPQSRSQWSASAVQRRRQKRITVRVSSRHAPGPLDLLVDIEPAKRHRFGRTGERGRVPGDGEWHARQHGTQRRRQYRKVNRRENTIAGHLILLIPGLFSDPPPSSRQSRQMRLISDASPSRLSSTKNTTGPRDHGEGDQVPGRRRVANRRENSSPDCFLARLKSASMEPAAVASGARSTSELMLKVRKFARWR